MTTTLAAVPDLLTHVRRSGHGGWWGDERALLVHCGPERLLHGDPARVDPAVLARYGRGQFQAPDRFLPLLGRTFTHVAPWVRVVHEQRDAPRPVSPHIAAWVRPLTPGDAARLDRLAVRDRSAEPTHWAARTWGGHRELAASGFAWGAFVGPYLASLACAYVLGPARMDLAVATDPAFRRLDLALACVHAATAAARCLGLAPTWSAPLSNHASRALAAQAGFRPVRQELVYWTGPAVTQ